MTNTERRTTSFWFKMRFHHWCCETSAPLGSAGWCFAVWKHHWVLRNLGARHGDEGDEERDEDHGDEGDEGHPGEDSDEDHVTSEIPGLAPASRDSARGAQGDEERDEDHVHEGDEGEDSDADPEGWLCLAANP